jgi:hypothetical protein
MIWVLFALIAVAIGVIIYGTATGRLRADRRCCAADPMDDARMRPYLLEDERIRQAGVQQAGAQQPE